MNNDQTSSSNYYCSKAAQIACQIIEGELIDEALILQSVTYRITYAHFKLVGSLGHGCAWWNLPGTEKRPQKLIIIPLAFETFIQIKEGGPISGVADFVDDVGRHWCFLS